MIECHCYYSSFCFNIEVFWSQISKFASTPSEPSPPSPRSTYALSNDTASKNFDGDEGMVPCRNAKLFTKP